MAEPPDDDPAQGKVLDIRGRAGGGFDADEPVDPNLMAIPSRPTRLGNTDWMRGVIALILMITFSLVAIASLFLVALSSDADKVSKALALVFGALAGLTGAVAGFYFGGRR